MISIYLALIFIELASHNFHEEPHDPLQICAANLCVITAGYLITHPVI